MNSDSQILITGATGFLGANLTHFLLQKGYTNISVLVRPSSDLFLIQSISDKIKLVEGDILEIEPLFSIIENVDAVFHCAGLVSYKNKDYDKLYSVNVEGTKNVVNACLASTNTRLVHVSSTAALALEPGQELVESDYIPPLQAILTNYGKTKFLGELEVWRGIEEGLSAAIINPSMILGGGFWKSGTANFFRKIDKGLSHYPPGANGFVDARDVCLFMEELMKSDVQAERFLLCGTNISFKDFFESLAKAMGKKPPSRKVTPLVGSIAWRLSSLWSFLTGNSNLITKETIANSSSVTVFDNKKSIWEVPFKFSYRNLEKTISDCSTLYKETEGQKGATLIHV